MPQKRLFGVSLLQTVFRRVLLSGTFPRRFVQKCFSPYFFCYTLFLQCKKPYTRKKTACAFYARQKRRQELSFSKVADFVEIREKQKNKKIS